jgi:hypothetical protein
MVSLKKSVETGRPVVQGKEDELMAELASGKYASDRCEFC